MAKKEIDFDAERFEKDLISLKELQQVAKSHKVSINDVIKRVGFSKTVRYILQKKRKSNSLTRRCKICREWFTSSDRLRHTCDKEDCINIWKQRQAHEYYELVKFKKAIAVAIQLQIKEKEEEKARKKQERKERWQNLPPEKKAALLETLAKARAKHQKGYKISEETIQQRKEKRRKRMNKEKLMKSALLNVLNADDETTGVSNLLAITKAVVERAKTTGDPRTAAFIRDTIDEMPQKEESSAPALVMFATPSALVEKFGEEVQDAEYAEVSEKEQYERLKAKFENPLEIEYKEENKEE